MKVLALILIIGLLTPFISCNRNKSKKVSGKNRTIDSICLLSVRYFQEEGIFITPDRIDLILSVKESITTESISNVIFKNIPQKDQELFVKSHHFKKIGDSLTLIMQTNYFNFDTLHKKSANDIEKILNNNISLVMKKDTIPLIYCK